MLEQPIKTGIVALQLRWRLADSDLASSLTVNAVKVLGQGSSPRTSKYFEEHSQVSKQTQFFGQLEEKTKSNGFMKNSRLMSQIWLFGALLLACQVTGQTYTTLHDFSALTSNTNSEGADPSGNLVVAGNIVYGTTLCGGTNGSGTLFAINLGSSHFTTLHGFGGQSNLQWVNILGYGLILEGGTLYGTTFGGGANSKGAIYSISTNGTGFTNFYSFTGLGDGMSPGALASDGTTLYGMANGGTNGDGTIFAVSTNGTGFSVLHTFTALSEETNSDGAYPQGLLLYGNTLYGTTSSGGSNTTGTVFAINTNGTGFTVLHTFTGLSEPFLGTNSDGSSPLGGLILASNTLFGTASGGGTYGQGTIFAMNTNGAGFAVIHTFTSASSLQTGETNSDGDSPVESLTLLGNTLYGTAAGGGSGGGGTVFSLNTNGSNFSILHSFIINSEANESGAGAYSSLALSGNNLYGTVYGGTTNGDGLAFSLSLATPLSIVLSGTNVILAWPTNATGFTLQFTTNLLSQVVWSNILTVPTVINGQNTVTNSIIGKQQFFRLSQ